MRVSVYVLNMRGQPLMPTSPRKARVLLKKSKATVVRRMPFTIQLKYAAGEKKQPITLGIDVGYLTIGFSAITSKLEILSGEVTLRKDVSKKLVERRIYRRNRRNRLWYRKPRFLNRTHSKKKGWLAPSIRHKYDSHLLLIEKIKRFLPITKIIVEVASFDSQKMQNPEIRGIEYQQGELQGYEVREYLLAKYKRKCIYCGKSGLPLQIEHIIPKSRGGSNKVSNLTISCRKCNQMKCNQTAGEFGYPKVQKQAQLSLKATAFMNNVYQLIVERLNCEHTYGFITKYQRVKLGIKKSHRNDAFIIAGGELKHERIRPFIVKQVRRNNRSLQLNRKGFKRSIRKQRYPFQPNDLVKLKRSHTLNRVIGTHCRGTRVMLQSFLSSGKKSSVSIKNIELVTYGKGLSFQY
ncbi:MAG: RNA-guided endonuclease IscB [Candidatus Hodarchaeales archaeon]